MQAYPIDTLYTKSTVEYNEIDIVGVLVHIQRRGRFVVVFTVFFLCLFVCLIVLFPKILIDFELDT